MFRTVNFVCPQDIIGQDANKALIAAGSDPYTVGSTTTVLCKSTYVGTFSLSTWIAFMVSPSRLCKNYNHGSQRTDNHATLLTLT